MTKIYLRNVKWEMKIITCLNEEATGIACEGERTPIGSRIVFELMRFGF